MAQLPLEPTHIGGIVAFVWAAVKGFRLWQRGAKEEDAFSNGNRQRLIEKLARLQTASDDHGERIGSLEGDSEEGRRAHYLIREENRRIHESLENRMARLEKRLKLRFLGDDEV